MRFQRSNEYKQYKGAGQDRFSAAWEDMWKRHQHAEMLPKRLNQGLRAERRSISFGTVILLDRATCHGQDAETMEPEDIRAGGVSLSTLQDFQTAFQGVMLDKMPVFCCTGAENAAFLAAFSALRRANGENTSCMQGIIGADPLGALAEEGVLPISLPELYNELAQTVLWADVHMPAVDTILIRSLPYHDGGASLAQEIACLLETGKEYLQELLKRGVTVQTAVRHMRFAIVASGEKRMDCWKVQVMERLWQAVLQAYALPQSFYSLRYVLVRADYNRTLHDPYFSLSGMEGMGTSWYHESVEEAFLREIHAIMSLIERSGGMLEALSNGILQRAIHKTRIYRLKKIAYHTDLTNGAYRYVETQERKRAVEPVDTEWIRSQRLADLEAYRADVDEHEKILGLARVTLALTKPALGLLDMMQEAFLQGATLGDIVIAFHAGQDDFYIAEAVSKHYLVEYVKMRTRKRA